ncbi:hypothetical protein Tco_0973295, partial [Tanacetum coccineum]
DLFMFAQGDVELPTGIWSNGDVELARVIMESLDEFKLTSGLVPSIPKSTTFFCNVLNHVKIVILNIMPFSEGELPIKYLGVPLISLRLLNTNCKVLVEKAKNRIGDWKNKSLSFAGRLQLCKSFISSMHIYWALVFSIPKGIILNIQNLICGFLWCNGDYKRGKAKVAWVDICLPLSEGGLGLRSLEVFNKALLTTHIWNIMFNKESLWVQWIHTYKLKGRSLCDIPIKADVSWGWRKLLQLRDRVRPYMWFKIIKRQMDTSDVLKWRDLNGSILEFSVKKVWEAIRPRGEEVDWYRIGYSLKDKNEAKTDKTEHRIGKSVKNQKVKEKLLELANTPLNENCSAVILKKLNEKLGDPGKFLIPCSFSELKLKDFAAERALIESFPPRNDDMTPEDVIREIEYLLNRDPLYSPNNDHIYTIPEMFTDEHTLDYSSHPRYDDADDDPFDSKENKIKVSKLLVDELDSTGSSSFLPHFLESDSVLYEDFSEVDTLTSTDNEDKVFNPGILVHENLYEVTNRVTPDKNVKKISSSNASLILEDYNPPLSDHELPFHIEIPGSGTLLSFSSENEEKVFNPGILISKGVHSLLPELSHRDSKAFKVINIFESPMEIFPCSYGEDIRVLDFPLITPDYEASRARGFVYRSLELHIVSFIMGIQYPILSTNVYL